MRPRPGTGVRTMPEIIKRDRMSQIHTKNYQKYINTRQIHNFAKSIMRPKNLKKTKQINMNLTNTKMHLIVVTNASITRWIEAAV